MWSGFEMCFAMCNEMILGMRDMDVQESNKNDSYKQTNRVRVICGLAKWG